MIGLGNTILFTYQNLNQNCLTKYHNLKQFASMIIEVDLNVYSYWYSIILSYIKTAYKWFQFN